MDVRYDHEAPRLTEEPPEIDSVGFLQGCVK